ncbi:hypothetical protein Glove_299g11 [Diversispora epigaea]|uniref:Uncharacterized protein n=1 Tax=Diversispora epigaea TaxID=1348612 RepID=A0A397HXR4_9GLOM|nr:hypothetical protein Glove_299g11 [Diversispora epigaea]
MKSSFFIILAILFAATNVVLPNPIPQDLTPITPDESVKRQNGGGGGGWKKSTIPDESVKRQNGGGGGGWKKSTIPDESKALIFKHLSTMVGSSIELQVNINTLLTIKIIIMELNHQQFVFYGFSIS